MRMFRLPSWISESKADKGIDGLVESKMFSATRPVVEIIPGIMSKRKRSPSIEALDSNLERVHEMKKQKMHDVKEPVSQICEISLDEDVETKIASVVDSARLRDTIESQFSLEILLKHDELRLINQEMAKCQVALEQLRRCSLIPYPTTQGTSQSLLDITNGTGPAISHTGNVPQWAPSYGVTDGPYSRHYAKWLIPDPTFDGVQVEYQRRSEPSRAGKTLPEGRSTRHSFAEGMIPATKSRNQRGTTGPKLQALSSGYPPPKGDVGPCTLRRGDGKMVKLVCKDCNRENFSSTQGFINHCRIAHKREFKSHEEAAVYSGVPIEVDGTGAIVGEERSPVASLVNNTPTGHVHPLILSAPTSKEAYSALLSRIDTSLLQFQQGRLPGVTSIPTSANSTPVKPAAPKSKAALIPSADTPHLSSWMRSKGLGGNLSEIVSEAKKQFDFEDMMSSHDEDSDEGEKIHIPHRLGGLDGTDSPTVMRVPSRAAMSPAPFNRPVSSKGLDVQHARTPGLSGISPRLSHATPVINTCSVSNHSRPRIEDIRINHTEHSPDADIDMHMVVDLSPHDLSPHTVASNNAPSLVSDDGEYDDGDDAESASSEGDEDSVAEIDIEDDGVEKVVPRTVIRNRSGSAGDAGMRLRKEDKHVTFVSPVKESGKAGRKK